MTRHKDFCNKAMDYCGGDKQGDNVAGYIEVL